MSLINRVLKDLDRQGATPAAPAGVRAVAAARRRPRWHWAVAALALAGAGLWLATPASAPQPSRPETAPARHPTAAVSPAPPRPELRAPTSTAAPQLRLATSLSRLPAGRAPAADAPQPKSAIRPPKPEPAASMPTPEPAPDPAVVKLARPPTPAEQAEAAWRQASRSIEQGRDRDARERLAAALQLDAGHARARQALIALTLEDGDWQRALTLLHAGQALHPADPWYARSLGQLHLQRGDHAQAAEALKAGLNRGADADYWGLYAATLSRLGRTDEVIEAYQAAARLAPAHGPWWVGLGVALEQAGRRPEAAAAYQRALAARLPEPVRAFAAEKAAALGAP